MAERSVQLELVENIVCYFGSVWVFTCAFISRYLLLIMFLYDILSFFKEKYDRNESILKMQG